jgi:hypothetical protein
MENRKLKVQCITDAGKWPYVGNAYRNRDGSISVYLDAGVTLTGGQKLYLREARSNGGAKHEGSVEASE